MVGDDDTARGLPEALFQPARGTISFPEEASAARGAAISIPLQPFRLPRDIAVAEELDPQQVHVATIEFDGVDLGGAASLDDLAGREFEFPFNPQDGYVDGSILLGHAHHPVDLFALKFDRVRRGALAALVSFVVNWDYEGFADLGSQGLVLSVSFGREQSTGRRRWLR